LERASIAQMTRYVDRYRPAILNSVKQAQKAITQSRKLPQFFSRVNRTPLGGQLHPNDNEEPPHRKHTKIRHLLPQQITKFFATNQPTT